MESYNNYPIDVVFKDDSVLSQDRRFGRLTLENGGFYEG
jgi:hypothetical protein